MLVFWEVSPDQDSSVGSAAVNRPVVILNWPGYVVI